MKKQLLPLALVAVCAKGHNHFSTLDAENFAAAAGTPAVVG
jgi:hypothetical protein